MLLVQYLHGILVILHAGGEIDFGAIVEKSLARTTSHTSHSHLADASKLGLFGEALL